MSITVSVISDVICPWCFIGKRRLERAVAASGRPVSVRWLPFQLNPTMPREGILRREYRTQKFGSWERSQELDARVTAVGQEEAIDFDFARIDRTPNTLEAHRLIWLAEIQDRQDAVVEALFLAYFTQGRNLCRRDVLLDVVTEAGLDRPLAEAVLIGNHGAAEYSQAEEQARRYGVDGVPFYVVNDRITLAGAQNPRRFVHAFQQALDVPSE